MSAAALNSNLKGEVTPFSEDLTETTVKLAPDILAYLREAAAKRGVTTGDMVRIALGTQKFLAEKAKSGAKVQIREGNKLYDLEF